MNPQLDFLKAQTDLAQSGDEAATAALRRICSAAAEQAPTHDLITMARCLYHVGIEAARIELRRN
jgi:hypothetical protein